MMAPALQMVHTLLVHLIFHLCFLVHITTPWMVEKGSFDAREAAKKLFRAGEVDEMLHAEHVYDVLFSRNDFTTHDTLIFLYNSSCQTKINRLLTSQLRRSLPEATSLSIMRHNYKAAEDHIWWKKGQREAHNDFQRMSSIPSGTCSCYAFVPQGSPNMFDAECQPLPASQEELVEQYWKSSTFQIIVLNRFDQPVKVSFSGKGPKLQELFLPSGSSTVVWAYPSYTARAYNMENNDFLQGWSIIHRNVTMIEIMGAQTDVYEQQWKAAEGVKQVRNLRAIYNLKRDHAERSLRNLHQPPEVHNFTETGFIHTRIPKDIYRELLDIYNSETESLRSEYYPYYYTFMNSNEVNIQQVTLSNDLSAFFSKRLKSMNEEFCQCHLKQLTGKGIITRFRMYPNGSRLRMHVDELGSGHVIGSILHLSRDLDGHDDWPLEVIDFQGNSQAVFTKPGDMVIFESSRLIHGRPTAFQGKFYINVFFYYIPQRGWHSGRFISEPEAYHPPPKEDKHPKTEL